MARKTKMLKCGCRSHRFVCINCDKPTCPKELGRHNDCYCDACWEKVRGGNSLKTSFECEIPGCLNRTDQGVFEGAFCRPCYDYITTGKGVHSQAYRNELVKANFRTLSNMRGRAYQVAVTRTFVADNDLLALVRR